MLKRFDWNLRQIWTLATMAAVAALTPQAHAEGGAAITGSAKFDGPRPVRKPIEIREGTALSPQAAQCAKLHSTPPLSEDQIVGEKGEVANVFVYVKEGVPKKDYPAPTEGAKLDQQNCIYVPHVQGVRVEQKFSIANDDALMHNIRSFSKVNPPFNIGQPNKGTRDKVFHKAENAIKIKCDVHKWMTAYVFAMPHPFYAVTGTDGKFKIEGLAPGDYTLAAWHEAYGEVEAKVKVTDKGATQDFTFKPKN